MYVEPDVHHTEFPQHQPFYPGVTTVDFAVTLGGDGTVLHLASLFAGDVPLPPVICFAMGTLGFLTPFDANDFPSCLSRVISANTNPLYCTLRTRKRCEVYVPGEHKHRVHHVLNECVIDRSGTSRLRCKLCRSTCRNRCTTACICSCNTMIWKVQV